MILTLKEVAEQLKISKMTVSRLIAKGQLIGMRVLSAPRVHQDDLDDYISKTRRQQNPPTPDKLYTTNKKLAKIDVARLTKIRQKNKHTNI